MPLPLSASAGSGAPRTEAGPTPRTDAGPAGQIASGPAGRIGAVDGLRGLALILVVAFHLFGDGRVSGGVDVFLLLSGYFATGSLLRRAETGRLRLTAHYARTLVRLLPAALVVLAAVTVALLVLTPRMRWSAVLREIGASATFWENWELARAALAYGAAGPDASPLQHFWSLSVQGQFFAVWPLVVLGVVGVAQHRARAGRTRLTPGGLLGTVTGAATAASFAGALWLVAVDQPAAYFSTFTRFWELGAGALLALALRPGMRWRGAQQWRSPAWARGVLGWAGLALVVGSGFLVDGAHVFPGAWTLVPVGGAALVVVATAPRPTPQGLTTQGQGPASPAWGVERILDSAPLRFGARVSYALYLWHWPVLVFWLVVTGFHRAGPVTAVSVLTVSAVLAWLTTRYVAEPLLARRARPASPTRSARRARPASRATTPPSGRRTLAVLTGAALLVLGGTQAAANAQDAAVRHDLAALAALSPDHPGAAALTLDAPQDPSDVPFRPATWVAFDDHPDRPGCAQSIDVADVLECTVVPQAKPAAVVYLAGASHEQQYEEAFVALAHEHGWELREMLKHGCRLAVWDDGGPESLPTVPRGTSGRWTPWSRPVRTPWSWWAPAPTRTARRRRC